jgi:hypothetical protein
MRMLWTACVLAAGLACTALPAYTQEHRQLGAHVHGHGRLNIAVDGKKVLIGLEVPGMDIVGFEHEASTPKERAAIPEAKAKLANALALFKPEANARCELQQVRVSLEAGNEEEHGKEAKDAAPAATPASRPKEAGHEDKHEQSPEHGQEQKAQPAGEHEHEQGQGQQAAAASGHEDEAGHHHHSEFHAEYALICQAPHKLTSMTFDYFNAFSGAQELDVSVITPKGQSSYEVKRGKPTLDLTGIM